MFVVFLSMNTAHRGYGSDSNESSEYNATQVSSSHDLTFVNTGLLLPSILSRLRLRATFLGGFLGLLPHSIKCLMYRSLCPLGIRCGWRVHPVLYRLPFGLSLKRKTSTNSQHLCIVEAAGLQYLESSKIPGVPLFFALTLDDKPAYMLSTYIDEDPLCNVLECFSAQDWERLTPDLQPQLRSLRRQTTSPHHICDAAGGIIVCLGSRSIQDGSQQRQNSFRKFGFTTKRLHHPTIGPASN
jgi:hypothetical protein